MDKNTNNPFTYVQRPIVILVLLVLLVSLSACDGTVTPALPEGAAACGGDGGNFKCDGQSGHQIFLSNVPPGVTPYLLPIPPGDDDRLRNAEKDGTNCIITIVGDLAFYDKENNLVRTFDPAVKISYRFLEEQDRGNYDKCLVYFPETIDYVPVAFYDNKVWRPVDPYTKADDGTVSFEFTTWGDQQGGFGTKP